MRGLSDSSGFWKTSWTVCRSRRARSPRAPTTSTPSTAIAPERTGASPTIARAVVDLPEPDSPTSPSVSPAPTWSETPSTATRPLG